MAHPKWLTAHTSGNAKNDDFYLKFLRLPDNIANILGAGVKSFAPPAIELETLETRRRGNTYQDSQRLTFRPIPIVFRADDAGLISMFLHTQIMRQLKIHPDNLNATGGFDKDYKFDIEAEITGINGTVIETIIYRNCFIMEFERSPMMYGDESDSEFTVMVNYDNVDYKVYDTYVSMMEQINP